MPWGSFVEIFVIALLGAAMVPVLMIGMSSVGLFEPLEFNLFGRRIRVGRHKD